MRMRLATATLISLCAAWPAMAADETASGEAVVGASAYATQNNPSCSSQTVTCTTVCANLPLLSNIKKVDSTMLEADKVRPAQGWWAWSGPETVNQSVMGKTVCRIGKNWSNNRDRVARLVVTYDRPDVK